MYTKQAFLRSLTAVFLVIFASWGVDAGGQSEAVPDSAGESSVTETVTPRIEYLEGEVSVDGVPAEIGASIPAGARISTGADGMVDIVFGSGNALRIEEDTLLTLDLQDPAEGIDISRGTIAAVFEGLQSLGTGPDDTFRVRAPTTVAGVRGTVFFVKIENPQSTYVCTCHGELEFVDDNLVVRAARHDATRFIADNGEVRVEDALDLYHDSQSLNAVADIVGVTIAWGEEPHD